MTTILHDFSWQRDLALHPEVIHAVQRVAAALGVDVLIASAFARELHLRCGYDIAPFGKRKISILRWRSRAGRLSLNCGSS